MDLWPHQLRYVDAARNHIRSGRRALLLVLPTGAGKTVLAVAICQAHFGRNGRILWIVHRKELIQQAADALRTAGVPCGIIAPWATRSFEPVRVASIQTLLARDQVLDGITMLVIDEAHHIVADTYLQVRRQYPGALVIGLTATPGRADNRGLGAAFDAMVAEVQPRELIASGTLVPCRVIGPRTAVDKLCDYPVDAYRADCSGRQAIVFVGSVQYAADLAQSFSVAGIPARSIDGAMSDADREQTIDAFRSRRLLVLTSVMVLTEGFDAPETSAIILARKVGSEVAYIQMVGRGMRRAPGKKDCICLDLYGSSHALHILPDSDRAYSLEGKAVRRSPTDELIDLPQCPACGTFFECGMWSGGRCPSCGWCRPPKKNPAVAHQEKIELQESRLQRMPSQQRKVQWLTEQLLKRGGHTGGILVQFSRIFHHFPNHTLREQSGFNKAARERKTA